ncbi:5508_t:CDS:2, partial [Scutellospora calospora]
NRMRFKMENYQGIPNDNTSKPLDHDNFDVESIYNFDELDIDISESLNDYVEELPMTKWDSLDVALKSLNNSKELTADILQEITYHQLFDHCRFIIYVAQCFGISQDPATKNYLMVMHYFEGGSLRQYLDNNYNELSFNDKLGLLYSMTNGLFHIHLKGLIHKDFHPGNILNKYNEEMQN